jgi:AcrR family transcriptional regulator
VATRPRLTRSERTEQTRAELVEAARVVFLRSGFHGASLEEISLQAGYTTGAVYSRFAGKDGLFLAVLDDHVARRVRIYTDAAAAATDFESAGRELIRAAVAAGRDEPGWTPLLMEFWTHAARREDLRKQVLERNDRQLDALVELFEELALRHGVTFRLSPRRLLQGHTALARGLGLERQLDPDGRLDELYEEYALAATRALTDTRSTT